MLAACSSLPRANSFEASNFKQKARIIDGFNVDTVTNAPLDIIISVRLKAPREDVWELVSDHDRLPEWVPNMTESKLLDEISTNRDFPIIATRQCILRAGIKMTVVDDIVFETDFAYGYSINRERSKGPKPVKDHLGIFTAEALANGDTLLTWRQFWKKGIMGQVAAPYMRRRFMEPAIDNLISEFGGERVSITQN